MTPEDSPVDTDETVDTNETAPDEAANAEEIQDADIEAAKAAWTSAELDSGEEFANLSAQEQAQLTKLAQPFVGEWNTLISTTNWEKGRIISEWREALIESGVDATMYSDEAWAKQVGGVTGPHVGRLRRVYDRFGSTYQSYQDVYWSHFLAALDWEDAPMWLEGASKESWSVSNMRDKRWEANGAVESKRPTNSQIVEVDMDEDITVPAQGGRDKDKDYDGDSSGVATGPLYEEPDFGDEEELSAMDGSAPAKKAESSEDGDPGIVQPFVGLPALPDDLSDAIESLKLSLLRHKTDSWKDVSLDDVQKYLDAIAVMIKA